MIREELLVVIGPMLVSALLLVFAWRVFRDRLDEQPEAREDGDGNGGVHRPTWPHPRRPFPRPPRRGPHGDGAPAAPARVRTVLTGRRLLRRHAERSLCAAGAGRELL